MNSKKLILAFMLAVTTAGYTGLAHADGGFDSTTDTNNFKANGTTVLTLTGTSRTAAFFGNATFAGSIQSAGAISSPLGFVSQKYGTSFIANAWDAVYTSIDNQTNSPYELIGSYHGWDPNSIYVAGYNAADNSGRSAATSISFGGWGVGTYTTAFVDLINHRFGVGTTAPQATLDVNGNVNISNGSNNAALCLNGKCVNQLPDFSQLFLVQSDYSTGSGTKSVSCPDNSVRISCSFFTNTQDGMSLINTYPVQPFAPRGCSLTTPENSDPWAVTAYCAPTGG